MHLCLASIPCLERVRGASSAQRHKRRPGRAQAIAHGPAACATRNTSSSEACRGAACVDLGASSRAAKAAARAPRATRSASNAPRGGERDRGDCHSTRGDEGGGGEGEGEQRVGAEREGGGAAAESGRGSPNAGGYILRAHEPRRASEAQRHTGQWLGSGRERTASVAAVYLQLFSCAEARRAHRQAMLGGRAARARGWLGGRRAPRIGPRARSPPPARRRPCWLHVRALWSTLLLKMC